MGVGIDLVGVSRMQRLLHQQPEIVHRVFTPDEQRYCDGKRGAAQYYAARFAAKEAVLKALGTGMGSGMEWTDVEVVRERSGRPSARLHGGVATLAHQRGMRSLELSLSHSGDMAVAHAVILYDADEDVDTTEGQAT